MTPEDLLDKEFARHKLVTEPRAGIIAVSALTAAGYAIVPREPTEAMVMRLYAALCADGLVEFGAGCDEQDDLERMKACMITAATKEGRGI